MGVPLFVSHSWITLFALATLFIALVQLPALFPSSTLGVRLLGGLAFSTLFFASVVFHEMAHAVVALSQKQRVHSITVMIFGGFTAIEGEVPRPRAEAFIAAAGPVASFVVGVMLITLAFSVGGQGTMLGFIAFGLGEVNLALAFLNMLPGLPLDGGRVFLAVAWKATGSRYRGAMAAVNAGRFLGLVEILIGLVYLFVLSDTVLGVSLILVGWFLRSAAGSAGRQFTQQETLKGLKVRDIVEARWPRVTIGTAISTIAEDEEFLQGRRSYLVYQDGTWAGMLPVRAVKSLSPEERRGLRVGDVMVPRENVLHISPEDDVLAALQSMERERAGYVPVLNDQGQVMGVLSREHIQQVVLTRAAAAQPKPERGGGKKGKS